MSKKLIEQLNNKKYYAKDKIDFPSTTGVYCIYFESCNSDKIYVGSTSKNSSKYKSENGFRSRFREHLTQLKNGKHHSIKLQNSYNKYGEEKIVFKILEICEPKECLIKEQNYINKYKSYKLGYNCRENSSSMLGFKHSDETKNKIKNATKKERDIYASEIIKLYEKNKTKEIAKTIGLCKATVCKILKENNIKLKTRACYTKNKIFQYNLDGNLIKEWESAYECYTETGIIEGNIRRVLKKQTSKAKGFYFDYKKLNPKEVIDSIKELKINMKNKAKINYKKSFTKERKEQLSNTNKGNGFRKRIKNIKQLDLCGNLIKVWVDSKEIVNYYKLKSATPILRVLKGERKKFRNCRWIV